jgi:FtsP/CotA-like multicopper oxidase with cupredoxin domain
MIARRTFLKAAAALGTVRFAAAEDAGVAVLTAQRVSAALIRDGKAAELWTYGDKWPPPVLRAKQGEEFRARFVNTLDRAITVHWFGVRGPAEMMSLTVEPGEANTLDCAFTPPDAGTFWFGPIADASRQREMGLYGMLIVDESTPLQLPDLPVIIDDWRLTEEGGIDSESFGNLDDAVGQGRLGNWFTANGVYRPRLKAPEGLFRLRLLNAANVRPMPINFKGADPAVIALDGQPVAPGPAGALLLSPGQRVDLLIPAGNGDIGIGLDLFEDQVELAYISRSGAGAEIADGFALPANPLPEFLGDAAQSVSLVIEGGEKGGLKFAILNGETLDLRALLEKGYAWAMNGVAGLGDTPWQVFDQGASVIVEADNRTAFEQPLCLHGHVWKPIEDGADAPWRDTAVIPPKSKMRLGFVADNPGTWGLHSLVAERADAGLFTSFEVRPSP